MYELELNIFNTLIVGSVFVGFTFSLLLMFVKRINQDANKFLGIVALIIVLWNIWVLSLDFDIFRYFPYFYVIPLNFSLALGPALYLYTKRMTQFQKKDRSRVWIHFVPVIFEVILHFFMVKEAWSKSSIAANTVVFATWMPIIQLCAIISILIYSIRSLKLIRLYHQYVKQNYSHDAKYSLKWLYRLIVAFAIVWFLLVPYTLVDYLLFDFQLGIQDYYPLYLLLSIVTLWISAEAFLKPEVILLESTSSSKEVEVQVDKPEIDPEIVKTAGWLTEQMERNLFYLDPELTLKSLGQALDIHPNMLSKVINEGLQKNFSDFVNGYRVEAVIKRLKDPAYDQITLLGISFDCGFNSKTTFNRVFKNITSKTPHQYKKDFKNM